ncbi:toprim domain-containing protein [Streptomyces sp. NPDC017260]|uniref:toprim domain-containing protein n=1 Tax=unclassified Streptomyces TaxID=2593676 RepID=UPI00379D0DEF
MKTHSPTDLWDSLSAFANPVPADVTGAMHRMNIEVLRDVSGDDSTELLARCPAHLALTGKSDRRPSFSVNSRTGLFHCFSCGYSGSFVQLVEDTFGWDRVEAFRWIAHHGLYRTQDDQEPAPRRPEEEERLTEAALALFEPPPPQALAARRLTAEACAAFGVLWNPAKKHWILPIRDPDTGELWGWQEKGKRFFRNYPQGIPKARTLFGDLTWRGQKALLLESPLDAVRAHALGIEGAFAAFGAHVSEAQMRLIKARCTTLVLGLDNDSAGVSSRTRLYERWRPRGLPMRFFDYSGLSAKDLGEMSDEDALDVYASAYHPWRRRRACSPASCTPTSTKPSTASSLIDGF